MTVEKMQRDSGIFVTIDGPNGVGKSAVARGIICKLYQSGFCVVETNEPTASPIGQLCREVEGKCHGTVYACLIAADRYYHLDSEINPALREGKIVISTRYVESSLALQRLDGIAPDFVWALNSRIVVPDISVILTAPATILEHRLSLRKHFSYFERTVTRQSELEAYLDAANFLRNKGFNVLFLDNGLIPIEENINQVIDRIYSII